MGQISTKYFFKLYRQKIFAASFESYIHSTGPQTFIHILPAACLNWNWFYCKSFCCSWLCSTCPENISKVKLDRRQSPNILSEIIEITKNGAWGNHFGKSPYYNFSTELNQWCIVVCRLCSSPRQTAPCGNAAPPSKTKGSCQKNMKTNSIWHGPSRPSTDWLKRTICLWGCLKACCVRITISRKLLFPSPKLKS